jgi:hypothetical protein
MIGQLLLVGVLLIQAVSHGVATYALIKDASQMESQPPVPVRTWLLPSLSLRISAIIALVFWLLATAGFTAAALSSTGSLLPADIGQPLAIAASAVSTLGIVLFSGIWPGAPNRKLAKIDTVIALILNAAILVLALVGWIG